MKSNFNINGISIGEEFPPYVIAEISANHNGNIENAKKLIKLAKASGASAVKIQTYRPDTITVKSRKKDFLIVGGKWHGRYLYDLYQEAHTPWEWHKELFDLANKIGITLFSSPFDRTAIDFLETLNTPAYKIASFEIVDLPLIQHAASTGKPLIISTGMATKDEIREAVEAARNSGCENLALLHCVSGYPTVPSDFNLRTILDLKNSFNTIIGLSDHTLSNVSAIASIGFGVSIIEKHFTLNRNGGGPDDSFSLEPKNLKHLCEDAQVAWQSIGDINYEFKKSEEVSIKHRRSLYYLKDMKKGQLINEGSIKSIRPGYGIPPKYFNKIISCKLKKDVFKHDPISWDDFDLEI
jgi:N-acetylneuraminate synthase